MGDDLLEHFQKTLFNMENKIESMQVDLSTVVKERRRMEECKCCPATAKLTSSSRPDLDMELILDQMKKLQEENRELAEDYEEMKAKNDELQNECTNYKEKYYNAQQIVEEQKRQLEMAHNATAQTQEQINAGLQLANERFNEQLQELRQLPFILKAKEIELQETMSKLKIAEKTINALSNDLEGCIVKCEFLTKDLEQEKKFNCDARLQIDTLKSTIDTIEEKCREAFKKNDSLQKEFDKIAHLEEIIEQRNRDIQQLTQQLDIVREEGARHASRIKERADTQRKSAHAQIAGLEKEMVHLRAALSSALKERDEIRYRMQNEVSRLERKFGEAQLEIRSLKSHVDILKTSYSNIFEGYEERSDGDSSDDDTNDSHTPISLLPKNCGCQLTS